MVLTTTMNHYLAEGELAAVVIEREKSTAVVLRQEMVFV
jgi:hypothetical protein